MAKAAKVQDQLVRELIRLKRKASRNGMKTEKVREVFLNSCNSTTTSTSNNGNQELPNDAECANGEQNTSIEFKSRKGRPKWKKRLLTITCAFIPVLLGILLICFEVGYGWEDFMHDVSETPCIIENNFFIMEMSRPLAPCNMCKNLIQVPKYNLIDKDEFLTKHAYTGRPAIISGATANWTAMNSFSFWFFRDLYRKYPGSFDKIEDECQFFPYNTDFTSLEEAFNMSDDQAAFKEGEAGWYIGW